MTEEPDARLSWEINPASSEGLQVRVYFLDDAGAVQDKVFPAGHAARQELGDRILAVVALGADQPEP
jgi:hypothetical protein